MGSVPILKPFLKATCVATCACAGMHGAALAWSLIMPPGTALLELWPQPGLWRLYEHTAEWAGLYYRSGFMLPSLPQGL